MAPKRKRKLKPRLRRLERREDGRNDDPDSDHDLEDHEEDHDQEDHDLLEDTGKEESPAAEENLGAAEKVIVDASTDSPAGRVKKRRRRVRAEHHSQRPWPVRSDAVGRGCGGLGHLLRHGSG